MTEFRHAKLMQDLKRESVTVEDLARASASLDGKRDHFDAGRGKSVLDDETGHYAGYVVEMEEIIERACQYAQSRK